MAARSRNAKSEENNTPANEEKKMSVDTLPPADENVTPPADETNPAPEPEVYKIPDDISQLALSDPFANTFGLKLLETMAEIKDVDLELKAASEGDATSAIVSYAESDQASENIQAIYGAYSELKAELDNRFAQLMAAVKTEKGDVQLTPAEIDNKKAHRKTLQNMAKNALIAFQNFAVNNSAPDDVKLFSKTIETMIGGKAKSTATATSSGGSEIRPRLSSSKAKGYVQVGEEKFSSFTPAIKAVKAAGAKHVSVGQLHAAWLQATLNTDDLNQWKKIPTGTTSEFYVGDENNQVKVIVHTEYDENES